MQFQCLGASIGRPGEVATLSPDVIVWDKLYNAAFAQWPQFKNHDFKIIPFLAGANIDVCVNNAFGCCMASGGFRSQSWMEDELNYFFPGLQSKASASTALTNQLKHLIPGESAQPLCLQVIGIPEACCRFEECKVRRISSGVLVIKCCGIRNAGWWD